MAIISSIKQGAARYAAAGLIAAGLMMGAAAAPAFAATNAYPDVDNGTMPTTATGNTVSTAVYLQADSDKLLVKAPTQINMLVQADGTLTGPSADATTIENGSVFGIHVSNIKTEGVSGFALDNQTSKSGNVDLNITPNGKTAVNAGSCLSGKAITAGTDWNMAKTGTDGATIKLGTSGSVSNITTDLAKGQQFGTINWTFAAGNL